MDLFSVIVMALLTLGLVALLRARNGPDRKTERIRRGTGHALLGLQEFIEPSVEHIFEVENREQKEEDDHDGEEYDPEVIKADLAASLGRSPIDPEEVRRYLTTAVRAGLDWRRVYEQAVREELDTRPFKAPSIPPEWRVAPIE